MNNCLSCTALNYKKHRCKLLYKINYTLDDNHKLKTCESLKDCPHPNNILEYKKLLEDFLNSYTDEKIKKLTKNYNKVDNNTIYYFYKPYRLESINDITTIKSIKFEFDLYFNKDNNKFILILDKKTFKYIIFHHLGIINKYRCSNEIYNKYEQILSNCSIISTHFTIIEKEYIEYYTNIINNKIRNIGNDISNAKKQIKYKEKEIEELSKQLNEYKNYKLME